ncbi:glycosyltransferase [Streptococcus himalayensis]|uniref:Glycosyl hydrolase family 8 n=1 Tax=Streptococcus himalayensis TaxID=1888195 RepID=A0A917AB82_9STRE|nr:glycosyltransferase [Streptococcus himalayensis]GGE36575.1 glycosyl hydrolase family 8 [Streptococcus himalayensis]
MMSRNAIVFAADNQYVSQLTTAIKSVCAHNQHIKFYILNDDISKEWFLLMSEHLAMLDCTIQDVKLVGMDFEKYPNHFGHINHVTYFRYMIPEVVPEDRVLYLDTDIIVTGDVTSLFLRNMEGKMLAAVRDVDEIYSSRTDFNAGVLLLNLIECRKQKFTKHLLEITEHRAAELLWGDQSALNLLCPDYIALERTYNCQVGQDTYHNFEQISTLPTIIHYSSPHKPWNTYSGIRLRNLWWFYHDLDWAEIRGYWKIRSRKYERFEKVRPHQCFILTNSQSIAHIDYLSDKLPEIQFNIAAYSPMGPDLLNLADKENIFLYPSANSLTIQRLLEESTYYLDINHYTEVDDIVEEAKQKGKKLFTFDHTMHRDASYYDGIVSHDNPYEMLQLVKESLDE